MRIFLLPLFFIISFYTATAQNNWTLEECINYAIENNIDVALQDINIEMAELGVKQKKHAFGPNMNTSFGYTQSFGRSIDYTTYEFTNVSAASNSLTFSNSIDLFQGMSRLNDLKKSNLQVESSKLGKEITEQNIQLQLLTTFLNVVMAKEQLAQAENQKINTQQEFDRVNALINAGIAAESDADIYEAQLATNDISITTYKNNISQNLNDLQLLLRLTPSSDFDVIVPELPDPESLSLVETVNQVYDIALENRPEIKSAELSEKIADYDLKIAKAGFYPTLSFSNNIYTNFSSQAPPSVFGGETPQYFDQLKDNMAYTLGLSLNVPIFNKNMTRLGVQQSNINISQSQLQSEKTKQDLYQAIVRAYNNAVFSMNNYQASLANERASKKAMESAQARLKAGLGSDVEFNVASNNYSIAVSKLIEAKYSYIFNIKYLDFYKGIPIELK